MTNIVNEYIGGTNNKQGTAVKWHMGRHRVHVPSFSA